MVSLFMRIDLILKDERLFLVVMQKNESGKCDDT